MSLATQVVPIVLTQGLDTKSDPKSVAMGRWTKLENAVFTAPGRLSKRHGYDTLSRSIQGSASTISSARALLAFNNELLLCDGQRMYSYSPSSEQWLDKGAAVSVTTSVTSVIRDSHTQSNPDSAVNGGVRATAWEDSRGGVRCAVQDVATGAFYMQDHLCNGTFDSGTSSYAQRPRVVAFGRDLIVFYAVANNLFYRRIGIASASTLGAEINPLATLVGAANNFDVLVVGSRIFIAYNTQTGSPSTRLACLDASFALTDLGSLTATAATNAIAIFADQDEDVYVAIASATAVRVQAANYAGVSLGGFAVESAVGVGAITGIVASGGSVARNVGSATVYYELGAGGTPSNHKIRRCTLHLDTGLTGSPSDFKRSVGLASRPFVYSGASYLVATFQSTLQATYFVLDSTGAVVAKINPHTGAGLRTTATVANAYATSAGIYEFACGQQTRLEIQGGHLYAFTGATIGSLDFVDVNAFSAAKINNNVLIGGGVVQAYDGVSLTEAGFHLFPEGVTDGQLVALTIVVTQQGDGSHRETTTFAFAGTGRIAAGQYFLLNTTTVAVYVWFTVDGAGADPLLAAHTGIKVAILSSDASTSIAAAVNAAINAAALDVASVVSTATVTTTNASNGSVTDASLPAAPSGAGTGHVAGSVQYAVIYEWSDNYGQIVRSAPSIPLSVTVTSGLVTIIVPTLRLTARDGVTRSAARIAIYRTIDSGTIPYRITSVVAPLLNDPTTDLVYFQDISADSAIVGNEILYTFGGVLEDDPPPAGSYVVTFKNRAIVAGGQDKNSIAYSQQTSFTDPISFNDALTIAIDQRGGDVTALAVMDDKLVIFKRASIFVMDGDGPNNTGQGGSFSVPSLVATDVGCISQQSVVMTDQGLMFQSAKGFYLLDRSLATQYIGAAVETFNGLVITGAQLAPNTNQVRFTTTSDDCLVYDYLVGQWATFTNHASAGCAVSGNLFHFVRPGGEVWRENLGTFVDAGNQAIHLHGETGWISVAGLQNYMRVRRLLVLGEYKGPHQLVIQVATDYSPAFTQYELVDATSLVASSVYGSDPVYGGSAVYGGIYTPYQFRVHIVDQKCQAIRFSIEDAQSSGYNEGYSLNAFTLEVGVKKGPYKVPAARSF